MVLHLYRFIRKTLITIVSVLDEEQKHTLQTHYFYTPKKQAW